MDTPITVTKQQKETYDSHINNLTNPHKVTATQALQAEGGALTTNLVINTGKNYDQINFYNADNIKVTFQSGPSSAGGNVFEIINHDKTSGNQSTLYFRRTYGRTEKPESDTFCLVDFIDGKSTWYHILGTHNYDRFCLPLTGGKITGNLTITGTLSMGNNFAMTDSAGHSRTVLKVFDDKSGTANYGTQLVIDGGGNTFIGGGESPTTLYTELQSNGASMTNEYFSSSAERLYLTADSDIEVETNVTTLSDRKVFIFTTQGDLLVPNDTRYTTPKARNISAYTSVPSGAPANGAIWLIYE